MTLCSFCEKNEAVTLGTKVIHLDREIRVAIGICRDCALDAFARPETETETEIRENARRRIEEPS